MSGQPRLQVTREHGALVAAPPLEKVGALLALNRERLARFDRPLFGQSLAEWRRMARKAIWTAARDYLSRSGEPLPALHPASLDRVLMAGHQPELFHPGVWVKHFALAGLARAHQADAINLIVDYDAVKSASLRVPNVRLPLPSMSEFRPRTEPVPFDSVPLGIPHEEWLVRDEGLFDSLPERARRPWDFTPFLDAFWGEVRHQAQRTRSIPERLTSARRAFERRWGCHNLEVPVSDVCRSGVFSGFAADLLADLPRFHRIHNDCVHEYRRTHGLKSRNHPVPDLARVGDWLEAPFWAWRAGQTQRRRLMVRRTGDALLLRAGDEEWPSLPFRAAEAMVLSSRLTDLEERGLKVRPRALTNTLFARLFVADLFIHGIGGGKYDELTDELIRRYYGAEPPAYMVLSGTLFLPFPTYPTSATDCRDLAWTLRDLRCNPQRYLDPEAGDPLTADLLKQKQEWIARNPQDADGKRLRWRALRLLTEKLQPALDDRRRRATEQLARCEQELKANAILRRRDYAFCLYPEAELRSFLTRSLQKASGR
ncbi:MAG: hypothetical protein HYS12_14690 [Planctomycetes bacterium]|nr:hypothetical protein [Planctomycetota bacterium]